jgi:hypothetical protein
MSRFIPLPNHCLLTAKFDSLPICLGILMTVSCWLDGSAIYAQSRTMPSHGKLRLDSYNHLLRDVHPASQEQSNYLQNRLFAPSVDKAERTERWERLDSYDGRRAINELHSYSRVTEQLSAGRPASASGLMKFWVLLSVFGDRAEVYDALASEVPPMPHDDFTATNRFIRALLPTGELQPPPLALEGADELDASALLSAWNSLIKDLHANGRVSARQAAFFHQCVTDYCKHGEFAMRAEMPASGRVQARKYLQSLHSLADSLYRPQQSAQIEQFVEQQGFAYYGNNMLGFIQHMLKNRVTPAQGSTAQLALAEVARPIGRVLEHEISIHFERIDSLEVGEGRRPYTTEYRQYDDSISTAPGIKVSQTEPSTDIKL